MRMHSNIVSARHDQGEQLLLEKWFTLPTSKDMLTMPFGSSSSASGIARSSHWYAAKASGELFGQLRQYMPI